MVCGGGQIRGGADKGGADKGGGIDHRYPLYLILVLVMPFASVILQSWTSYPSTLQSFHSTGVYTSRPATVKTPPSRQAKTIHILFLSFFFHTRRDRWICAG